MLLGLRTVVYQVSDLDAAKEWYTALLGFGPYFDEPFYVGFEVGGYEFGLLPGEDPSWPAAGQSYWGVSSMDQAWAALIESGAEPVSEPTDVGEGILVAVARDPSGNLLGLIQNPHFSTG